VERLLERRTEIEEALLAQVRSASDDEGGGRFECANGLRAVIEAAVEHAISAVEMGEERCPPPPQALLSQARHAAREGVGLDSLYPRYVAGQALIADFLLTEALGQGIPNTYLQRTLRAQASVFGRLLEQIATEHTRETQKRLRTHNQRQAERIERLLAGEPLDTADFAYDLDAHHLALVAKGVGAEQAIRGIATELHCRALTLRKADGVTWAWLGSRRELDLVEAGNLLSQSTFSLCVALGEPAKGLPGWRLTHRQAKAAFRVAQSGPGSTVRYAEVALLATALGDELLATSLRQLYLTPLAENRDKGKVARETLDAYFQTARNVSSAAALLGVSRRTVGNRLRAIEGRLGGALEKMALELELALRLQELEGEAGVQPRE
jgi:PucR C-terminal helix-turn-helix domain/GGDEF-like domain